MPWETFFPAVSIAYAGIFFNPKFAAAHPVDFATAVLIESNLRPAGAFYRNLMLPENMLMHGESVQSMLGNQAQHYTDALKRSVQEDFDFTPYVHQSPCRLFALYGNRGLKNYSRRVSDLCLDKATEAKLTFKFIRNACHMPMIENLQGLAEAIAWFL